MRILFTFIGGLGHFHPLEPVARAAVAAGHQAAVAGSGSLLARIEGAGFMALATSPVRPPATPGPRVLTPPAPVDARAAEIEFAENFADKGARRHASAVQEHIRAWRPDVVVRDEADFGSAIAAEVLGIPSASVLVLAAGTLLRPELVAAPLATLRDEHGLPPDPELAMVSRDLVLSPFAPSFRSPSAPLPLPAATVSFRPGERVPRRRRTSRPRVYVTLGTVFNAESGDLFDRLLAGVRDIDADVLVTVGRDLDPHDFGRQPDHVRLERFVPQAEVLRHTDLVVSHGGSGSLMAALTHGIPSVLLPLGADQPHNAQRAAELGLARVLDAATVTPEAIAGAVNDVLGDQTANDRARTIAKEIDDLPDAGATVPALEALRAPDGRR